MGSPESFIVPPGCALRRDFPEGVVHVQIVGSESHNGPTHVDLYAEPGEAIPRVPRLHLKVQGGPRVAFAVEAALQEAHTDELCFSDGDYGCIALDSLEALVQAHHKIEANI